MDLAPVLAQRPREQRRDHRQHDEGEIHATRDEGHPVQRIVTPPRVQETQSEPAGSENPDEEHDGAGDYLRENEDEDGESQEP